MQLNTLIYGYIAISTLVFLYILTQNHRGDKPKVTLLTALWLSFTPVVNLVGLFGIVMDILERTLNGLYHFLNRIFKGK